MNANKVLAAEYAVSMAAITYNAVRSTHSSTTSANGYYPLPPTVTKATMGWLVLALIGSFNAAYAAVLGAGFLLAQFLRNYQNGFYGPNANIMMPGLGQAPNPNSGKLPKGTQGPAQWWGKGSGMVVDPLPLGFQRTFNAIGPGTQGATGSSTPESPTTSGGVQTV